MDPSHRGPAASLYADLLAAALAAGAQTGGPSVPEVVVELRRRDALRASRGFGGDGSPTDALSAQIAYDVALLRCAELLGIDAAASEFDPPAHGRTRVEQAIAARFEEGAVEGPTATGPDEPPTG